MSEQQGPVYGDVPRYGYQHPGTPAPPGPPHSYPSGPPNPYDQPLPPTYSPAYGPPPAPFVPVYPYAPWIRRVGAYLIDFAPALVAQIPFCIGYVQWFVAYAAWMADLTTRDRPGSLSIPTDGLLWMGIGSLLMLAALGWQIHNRWLTAGRTGQSLGKRVLKLHLLAEPTGQPIGPLNAFARDLVHILDGIAYVGYLWPLWDDKRQTFADKLMRSVVVDDRQRAPLG